MQKIIKFKLIIIIGFCLSLSIDNIYAADKNLKILFIGNSYTYTNNMPDMVAKIASSHIEKPINIEVAQYAKPGAKLVGTWGEGKALKLLKSDHWDFVVLQEQSAWVMYPYDIERAYEVAPKWREAISEHAEHLILFVTWAREPNSKWYTDPKTAFFQDADYMQKKLNYHSQELAKLLGAIALPIGDFWAYISNKYPDIDLYNADKSHPSATGSYLNALIFYRFISGNGDLKNITYIPKNVKPEDGKILQALASG